jgi:ribosomal protein S18 acetylase RimI-like enzyme
VIAFLCGFRSQTHDDEAYIHFVGVDPAHRGSGLARELYERFFEAVAPRTVVRAVTAPVNERSVAFHRALGFEVERVDEDYDGRGEARVLLMKRL